MPAIETKYNGHRFRCRLEAKWAVFLDAMGIEYDYEREGYTLNGLWYLPDFWLPLPKDHTEFEDAGYWLEIKPRLLTAKEALKIERLVRDTGHHAFAICGRVGLGEYLVSKWAMERGTKEVSCVYKNSDDYYLHFSMWNRLQPSNVEVAFEDALNTARAARFEHGETPKVLCPPAEKWYMNSLGLSTIDGGGRDWWIESEAQPGETIYFCGNDHHVPKCWELAEGIVDAHNSGDRQRLRYLLSLKNMTVGKEEA
ncbi:MAG: hypothetical protein DMF72_17705 [Acidobacteria bacterium]|nr:MAG: hypothetical protein DMF72_17705 [Acidobacteriota bacterium]